MTYDERTVNQQFRFQNWGGVLIRRGGAYLPEYTVNQFFRVLFDLNQFGFKPHRSNQR